MQIAMELVFAHASSRLDAILDYEGYLLGVAARLEAEIMKRGYLLELLKGQHI